MPNNPFGVDFASAGHAWTAALCGADSDGDGLTNGEELGDPCCVWFRGAASNLSSYATSHPGFASSVSLSPTRAASCAGGSGAAAAGPPAVTADLFFNPGEVALSLVAANPGLTLTNATTNYWQYAVNLPADRGYKVAGWSVSLHHPALVHHFLVNGCPAAVPAGLRPAGPMATAWPAYCEAYRPVWGWAPGSAYFAFNKTMGLRIGAGSGVLSLVVEVHYSNPAGGTAAFAPVTDYRRAVRPTVRPPVRPAATP